MININIGDFLWQFWTKLQDFGNVLYSFLTYQVHIPIVNIDFSLWGLIGGVGLIGVVIYSIVKS